MALAKTYQNFLYLNKPIAMSFTKIDVHLVFSTLERKAFLDSKELRVSVGK
ncbi:MAG: hypothetical protein KUL76_03520 [Kaistella sp.]|nr:hypothetical protein [Kaistella sp.]